MWINWLFFVIIFVCTCTDLMKRKIYNNVLYPSVAAALLIHLILGGWSSFFTSLLGLCTGFFLLLIPYLLGGIGAGDVKFLAMVGAFQGSVFVLVTALYMAYLGGVLAVLFILVSRDTLQTVKHILYSLYARGCGVYLTLPRKIPIKGKTYPYGVAIAGGAVLSYLFRGRIIP